MKILKRLFGGDIKIHVDEIVDSAGKLLGESVIVESGSNENGRWIKWADGTMITSFNEIKPANQFTSTNRTLSGLTIYTYTLPYTYPQPFVGLPTVVYNGSGDGSNAFQSFRAFGTSGRNVTLAVESLGQISPNIRHNAVCIGRWKE